MKWLGRTAAVLGLVAAVVLLWKEHPRAILDSIRAAGLGLILACLAHALPMLVSAWVWRLLFLNDNKPGLCATWGLVWIRESINSLLPVARIGGELVSFHLLKRNGVSGVGAAASLLADLQLSVLSQLGFVWVGIIFLLVGSHSPSVHLGGALAAGAGLLIPCFILFALIQHARPFERISRGLNKLTLGKFSGLVDHSAAVDNEVKRIWERPKAILQYLFCGQPLHYLGTSLEIWAMLVVLHAQVSLPQAIILESLVQALGSAAFFVPSALGVQEGGFLLIGTAIGLSPVTCLALAGGRRLRDVIVFGPGLLAWQFTQARFRRRTAIGAA